MSISPSSGLRSQQPVRQPVHQQAAFSQQKDTQLSTLGRVGKIVLSPVSATATGISSCFKATLITAATAGGLAKTSHPLLAAIVGLSGLVFIPLYALGKAIGRFFSNLKAGITGHTAPKK